MDNQLIRLDMIFINSNHRNVTVETQHVPRIGESIWHKDKDFEVEDVCSQLTKRKNIFHTHISVWVKHC